jgi:ferredoxin
VRRPSGRNRNCMLTPSSYDIYFLSPLLNIHTARPIPRRRFFMAHKISDACLACGTCVPECPVQAISEGDPIYVIDAGTCTDCGACVSVCPAEAIAKA